MPASLRVFKLQQREMVAVCTDDPGIQPALLVPLQATDSPLHHCGGDPRETSSPDLVRALIAGAAAAYRGGRRRSCSAGP